MRSAKIYSVVVALGLLACGSVRADPWVQVAATSTGLYLADLGTLKTVNDDQKEVSVMSSGRGGLDVSVGKFLISCKNSMYAERAFGLIDDAGNLGELVPLSGMETPILATHKSMVGTFDFVCKGTSESSGGQRNFRDAVTYLRTQTPTPN